MQILASVDESDIGKIEVGQTATFTVAAFPTRTFNAVVKQKRLLSAVTDNVVNYTVVLSVENTDGKLLPGMTATVKFLTQRAENVLAVSNSALRFTPTAEMLGADSAVLTARRDSLAKRAAAAAGGPPAVAGGSGPAGAAAGLPGRWFGAARAPRGALTRSARSGSMDSAGRLRPQRVRTGVTDGQKTQVSGRDLMAGMRAAIGISPPPARRPRPAPPPIPSSRRSNGTPAARAAPGRSDDRSRARTARRTRSSGSRRS